MAFTWLPSYTFGLCLQEILGGIHVAAERYHADFFEKFRSKNIVELAVDYARVSTQKTLN